VFRLNDQIFKEWSIGPKHGSDARVCFHRAHDGQLRRYGAAGWTLRTGAEYAFVNNLAAH
jgi:hypothetical protein